MDKKSIECLKFWIIIEYWKINPDWKLKIYYRLSITKRGRGKGIKPIADDGEPEQEDNPTLNEKSIWLIDLINCQKRPIFN